MNAYKMALCNVDRRDGAVVRASASQSVDLGFIPLVESHQKTFKNDIHSFPAWRSAFRESCGEQAGKFACCVLGQGTYGTPPSLCGRQGPQNTSEMATPKRVQTSRPKYSDTICFLVNGG